MLDNRRVAQSALPITTGTNVHGYMIYTGSGGTIGITTAGGEGVALVVPAGALLPIEYFAISPGSVTGVVALK